MAEIQRARMIDAMVESCRERGAARVTVAHVVSRAGVSRRTFYELFADREECFLAAFDDASDRAMEHVRESYDPEASWRARIRGVLLALLELFEDEPALGRLLVVESLGAGPRALERRSRLVARMIREVEAGGKRSKRSPAEVTGLTAEGLVGAAISILQTRLSEDDAAGLRKLVGPLMAMIVLPYLGERAAGRELSEPLGPRQPPKPRPAFDELRDLDLRLTYRTVMVMRAVAQRPGASNREIGRMAGIEDQGQISKLLARLERIGLVHNDGVDRGKGMPNAWTLTSRGEGLVRTTRELVEPEGGGERGRRRAPARPSSRRR
jgi:AcrR family transcriptional regulator